MNVEKAIYDVLERLGLTSDDSEVDDRLISQWLSTAMAKVLGDWLPYNTIPSSMIRQYEIALVNKKFELPVSIFEIMDDGGIISIARPGGKSIEMIDGGVGGIQLERNSVVGMPTEYWYRTGTTVHVFGKFPDDLKLDVILVPNDLTSFEKTDPFPAPSEFMDDILEEAERIGNRKLQRPHDINNDGKDLPND